MKMSTVSFFAIEVQRLSGIYSVYLKDISKIGPI